MAVADGGRANGWVKMVPKIQLYYSSAQIVFCLVGYFAATNVGNAFSQDYLPTSGWVSSLCDSISLDIKSTSAAKKRI